MKSAEDFGVYVHIPFCTHRCDYCAFATFTDRHHLWSRYAAACRREIASAALPDASSVFFGGGTPSLLPASELVSILAEISRRQDAEVTVECNPETVTAELLETYRQGGVTRLSFGVQSTASHVLVSLGREHDKESVRQAVKLAAEAGYGRAYSMDLIFGATGESLDDWGRTLSDVLSFDPSPTHVSAYALTIEPGTPLASDRSRHPDPDDQADKYLLADRMLTEAGLKWYEVSNWAAPEAECRHNQLYWRHLPYRGIGSAAHSHEVLSDGSSRRWWNVRTPDRYSSLIEAGQIPESSGETLTPSSARDEALALALRTREGVPAAALDIDDPALEDLIYFEGDRAVLTLQGRLLANEVSLRLKLENP